MLDLVEETYHQVDKVDKADNNQVYIEEEKWGKTTKKESKGTEEGVKELEKLHDLLGDLVRPEKRDRLRQVERQVNKLESHLYNQQELIKLLLPLIAKLLSLKVEESKEEVIQALIPIIDEVIRQKSKKDGAAMTRSNYETDSKIPSCYWQYYF